jgi:hypothetical protein
MKALREQIKAEQRRAGVHVIKPPHALGFLDPNQSKRKQRIAITVDVSPQI